MSIIKHPLLFSGSKGELRLYSLFDSGAGLSCIHQDFVEKLEIPQQLPSPMRMETASEGKFLEINKVVRLEFYINDIRLSDEFLVVPGLSEEVIIGAATLQKWRIHLDFGGDAIFVDSKAMKMQIGILKPVYE